MSTNPNAVAESQNKPDETLERHLAAHIATQAFQLLVRSNMLRDEHNDAPIIYAWTRTDRVILIVDPLRLKNIDGVISHRFRHHLGTILQGRRVVVTNHRGVFVQIAYWPEPVRELVFKPLDISEQPSPLHVPVGHTAKGDLWLSIAEMDAVLIGGARRIGKTNLLHGWIRALLHGAATRLILYDGKGGVEFGRYAGQPRVQIVTESLAPALAELFQEMNSRLDLLREAQITNLTDYNKGHGSGGGLERIVFVVDEIAHALEEPGVVDVLVDLAARGGAAGIHPVMASQRPSSNVITPQLKGNLVTRIAFPVPARADSFVVLDHSGAEKLQKTPGRLLIRSGSRMIEAQAFLASTFEPVEKVRMLPGSTRLSTREQRLAAAALEREGWFKIRDIAMATGESRDWVNAVARKWQTLGWLTEVQRSEKGQPLGRRITPALSELLGENGSGGPADERDLAD